MLVISCFVLALLVAFAVRALTDLWFWDHSLLAPLRQRTMAWTGKIGTLLNCRFCFSVQAAFWLTLFCVVPYLWWNDLSGREVILFPLIFLTAVHLARLLADFSYQENDAALMNEGRAVQGAFFADSESSQADLLSDLRSWKESDESRSTTARLPDILPFPFPTIRESEYSSEKDDPSPPSPSTDEDKLPTG